MPATNDDKPCPRAYDSWRKRQTVEYHLSLLSKDPDEQGHSATQDFPTWKDNVLKCAEKLLWRAVSVDELQLTCGDRVFKAWTAGEPVWMFAAEVRLRLEAANKPKQTDEIQDAMTTCRRVISEIDSEKS